MPKRRIGWDKRIEDAIAKCNFKKFEDFADKGFFDSTAFNDKGENYMFIAVRSGSAEMVQFLLQKGVAPDKKSKSGEIPVHIALDSQNTEMLEALVTADIAICWSKDGAALKQLYIRALEAGKENSAIFFVHRMGVEPEYIDDFGNNEFHFCAKYKMLELAKILPLSKRLYEYNDKFEKPLDIALLKDEGASYVLNLIESLAPELQGSKTLLVYKARALIKSDRFEDAISLIDSIVMRFPDDPRLPFLKGVACLFTKNYEGAVENLERSLELKDLCYDWIEIARNLLYHGIARFREYQEEIALYGSEADTSAPSFGAAKAEKGDSANIIEPPYPCSSEGRGIPWARGLLGLRQKSRDLYAERKEEDDDTDDESEPDGVGYSDSSLPAQFLGASNSSDDLDLAGDIMTSWSSSV